MLDYANAPSPDIRHSVRIALLIIIASTASGCSLTDRGCLAPLRVEELVGTWDWTRSTGGFIGTTITPETEGTTAAVEFTSDCRLKTFENGSLVETSRYSVRPGQGQDTVLVREDHFVDQSIRLRASQLDLYDHCADCYAHYYVRRAQP